MNQQQKQAKAQVARFSTGGQLLPGAGRGAGVHRSKKKLPANIDRKRWKSQRGE